MKPILRYWNLSPFCLATALFAGGPSMAYAQAPVANPNPGSSSVITYPVLPNQPEKKDYSLAWSTELGAEESTDSLSNQHNLVEMGLKIKFDMTINPWMSMNLTPKFVAQNGYIQAPDAVDPQGSRIDIVNASLDLKPTDLFNVSIGSLDERQLHSGFPDEDQLHSGIFMTNRSFPALRLVSRIGAATNTHVYAFAETAMPTSTALSNNSQDMGSTPSLNTAGLGFQLGSERAGYMIQTFANTFQYSGLSQDLATSSVLLGNTGINTAGSNYTFKYNYAGFEEGFRTAFHIARPVTLEVSAYGVQNSQAPTGQNMGWLAGGCLNYDLSKALRLSPSFSYFHIESDSTVAAYNVNWMNTNREGYRTAMKFHYNRKINFELSYGQRVPLVANPTQPSETWYGLSMETENAKF